MRNLPFTILLLSLFVFACKQDPPVNSLNDIFTNIGAKPEAFKIDASVDNIVTGKKGTAVFIPADAFEFEDGTKPAGEVKVEMKEFYSTADMLAGNLQTTSYGEILVTRGMVNITATADGKALKLKEDKAAIVCFPKKGDTTAMGIFYGEYDSTKNITWTPGEFTPVPGEMGFVIDEAVREDTALFDCSFTIPVYNIIHDSTEVLSWKFDQREGNIFSYLQENFRPSAALRNAFCKEGYSASVEVELDYISGKIKKAWVKHQDGSATTHDKEIVDFFMSLPAFRVSPLFVYSYNAPYFFLLRGHNNFSNEKYKTRFERKYKTYKDKAIEKIDKAELNYYVFTATKLGWINCDYFWESTEERIDFAVKPPGGNDAKVLLSFTDIKSIMNGTLRDGQFVFENVPAGRKVKVIAISYANSKPLLSVSETEIKKEPLGLTAFKEFTLSELEAELNKLN